MHDTTPKDIFQNILYSEFEKNSRSNAEKKRLQLLTFQILSEWNIERHGSKNIPKTTFCAANDCCSAATELQQRLKIW